MSDFVIIPDSSCDLTKDLPTVIRNLPISTGPILVPRNITIP